MLAQYKTLRASRDLLFFNPVGVKKSNTKETPLTWGFTPNPTKELFEKSSFETQKLYKNKPLSHFRKVFGRFGTTFFKKGFQEKEKNYY